MKQVITCPRAANTALAVLGSIIVTLSHLQASIIQIPYAEDTRNPDGEQWVHLAGGDSISWKIGDYRRVDFRSAEGGGVRYVRVMIDLRDGLLTTPRLTFLALTPPGDFYTPASSSDMFQASGSGGGWNATLEGVSEIKFGDGRHYPANPINGWTANDGSGVLSEVINWIMLKPDGQTNTPTVGDNPAVALGFVWDDKDNTGAISDGDLVVLKYAVTADEFTEIDSVEKIESFLLNETNVKQKAQPSQP